LGLVRITLITFVGVSYFLTHFDYLQSSSLAGSKTAKPASIPPPSPRSRRFRRAYFFICTIIRGRPTSRLRPVIVATSHCRVGSPPAREMSVIILGPGNLERRLLGGSGRCVSGTSQQGPVAKPIHNRRANARDYGSSNDRARPQPTCVHRNMENEHQNSSNNRSCAARHEDPRPFAKANMSASSPIGELG
jgi:hypothetical protein